MKKHTILKLISFSTLSLLLLAGCNSSKNETNESQNEEQTATTDSSADVDLEGLDYPQLNPEVAENEDLVEMETTMGNIKIKLFPEIAPKAVENFITHAKNGYYNDTTFHRIIKEFMIQGGDPKGDGTGGKSIWNEPFEMETSNRLYHLRGALSMARSSEPVSQGSQFFIVQNDEDQSDGLLAEDHAKKIIEAYKNGGYPALDGQYTVFGQVVEGMDVVDKIASVETVAAEGSTEKSQPKEEVKVLTVKVLQEAK